AGELRFHRGDPLDLRLRLGEESFFEAHPFRVDRAPVRNVLGILAVAILPVRHPAEVQNPLREVGRLPQQPIIGCCLGSPGMATTPGKWSLTSSCWTPTRGR